MSDSELSVNIELIKKIDHKPTGGFPNIFLCTENDINFENSKNREFSTPVKKTISIRDIIKRNI